MPQDKFQAVAGLRLHYLDWGDPSKPAVICLHGLSGNAHNFDALAPHLTDRYRVVALDIRGRGDSEWGSPMDYNPQIYASDLKEFLSGLGIDRATLVGTSMGGIIAMMFAAGYPARVERLILNDIGAEIDPVGLQRIIEYISKAPERFNDLGDVASYYRSTYPPAAQLDESALLEWVRWSVRPADGGYLTWKMDPAIRRPPRGGSAARPLDLWLHFTRVAVPILIVRGAASDILSAGTASRMLKVQRGARLVEVPEVGHAPSLVEPAALAAIVEFLGVTA
jgi:esterase